MAVPGNNIGRDGIWRRCLYKSLADVHAYRRGSGRLENSCVRRVKQILDEDNSPLPAPSGKTVMKHCVIARYVYKSMLEERQGRLVVEGRL